MLGAARMGALEAWYEHIRVADLMAWMQTQVGDDQVPRREVEQTGREIAKARTRDSARVLTRLADEIGGRLRFVPDPPLIVPLDDMFPPGTVHDEIAEWMGSLVATYRRSISRQHHPLEEYRYMDTARKVVGVGSVGTRAWVILFTGRDDGDPLVLQAKEAQPSVLERFLGRSRFANHGRRVTEGQRLMQGASDIFLGWLRLEGVDGQPARLLRPSAPRLEGQRGHRQHAGAPRDQVRVPVRRHPRPGARALGRPDRDRRVPRQGGRVRARDDGVRRDVRGPERT